MDPTWLHESSTILGSSGSILFPEVPVSRCDSTQTTLNMSCVLRLRGYRFCCLQCANGLPVPESLPALWPCVPGLSRCVFALGAPGRCPRSWNSSPCSCTSTSYHSRETIILTLSSTEKSKPWHLQCLWIHLKYCSCSSISCCLVTTHTWLTKSTNDCNTLLQTYGFCFKDLDERFFHIIKKKRKKKKK